MMRRSNEGRILLVLIVNVLLFVSDDSDLILAEKASGRRLKYLTKGINIRYLASSLIGQAIVVK